MKLFTLIFLLLTGCFANGNYSKPVSTTDVEVVNRSLCEDGWNKAVEYMRTNGTELRDVKGSRFKITLYKPNIFAQLLMIPRYEGFTKGYQAESSCDPTVILHEIGHLVWKLEHNWRGIMFPVSDLGQFSTGFTDEEHEKIRSFSIVTTNFQSPKEKGR